MLETREVPPGEVPRDDDGTRLLFTEEIARRAKAKRTTIRNYNSVANRQRRAGKPARFPEPACNVRRTLLKGNGQPVSVETPVWREDVIADWLRTRHKHPGRPATGKQPRPRPPRPKPVPGPELAYAALREHAGPGGLVQPSSAAELGGWCGLSAAALYRALASLESAGRVEWQRGSGSRVASFLVREPA